jgi:two-component system, chemotaxis family, chemotaxis protein CheY
MKLRALVVEDDDSMRNLLKQALTVARLAEFQFAEARDGQEALEKLDPSRTDILFVDWNMPKLTGIDLVRRVRALKNSAHIRIVMVTGLSTMGNIEAALDEAGANLYITKPYTVDRLRQQLGKLIEEMAAERDSAAPRPAGLLGRLIPGRPREGCDSGIRSGSSLPLPVAPPG